MGCLFSSLVRWLCPFLSSGESDARSHSRRIDKEILMELKNEPDEIEVLLLGPTEAGKSTFLKQARIIYR